MNDSLRVFYDWSRSVGKFDRPRYSRLRASGVSGGEAKLMHVEEHNATKIVDRKLFMRR